MRDLISTAAKHALVLAMALVVSTAAPAADLTIAKPVQKILEVLPKAWVKTGLFNEVDQAMFATRTIHAPEILRFKWGTAAAAADQGFWRLVQVGPGAGQTTQLATGVAGPGKAGLFSIDLRQHLPAAAPAAPSTYHVQVVARQAAAVSTSGTTSAGQAGKKTAAKEVSHWSPPVVITYVAGTTPITKFEFPEVYRTATLVLDRIILVTDQSGPGQEEYHVAGFVQELFLEQDLQKFILPGTQARFGPYRRDLNPPTSSTFGVSTYTQEKHRWGFTLGSETHKWPRRYLVAISLMEEDAGSEMAGWRKGVKQLAKDVASSELLDLASDELEDYLAEHIFDGISYVADAVKTIADSSAATGVGIALAVVVPVAVAIYEDSADDNYGTRLATLTLPSARVDEVHKLAGKLTAKGTYVTKARFLEFKGPAPSGAAAATDGTVHIVFHWEFSGRTVE